MNINETTILVTGGSSGLGAACAAALLDRGTRVVIADLLPPRDAGIAGNDRVLFAKTDVTSEGDVQAAIDNGQSRFGPLRGVVHCAGILKAERMVGRTSVASLEVFRQVIEVNLIGTFNVLRLAAFAMAKTEPNADGERGVMITTSSVAAFEGQIGQASYSASKGGVAAMTLPLARELGGQGIRVVSVAPGVFETPMMEAAPEKTRTSLLEQTQFPKRFGLPAEFAAMVLHVFENAMLNGTVIRLDGGIRMNAK